MDPISDIGGIVLGCIKRGEMQTWTRLAVSFVVTFIINMVGIFGVALGALLASHVVPILAMATALSAACTGTAVCLTMLWRSNPATKNIPILYSFKIETARIEALKTDGVTYDPELKKETPK